MNLYKVTGIEDSALLNSLDKEVILQYTSEEEIFSLVFDFEPVEYQTTTSPIRKDSIPGAYFERFYYSKDRSKLLFKDWADPNKNIYDCFDIVQIYFGLNGFKETLQFVKEKLIDGKPLIKRDKKIITNFINKKGHTEIYCSTTNYSIEDKLFWSPYGIKSNHLLEDKVFKTSKYYIQKPGEEYRTSSVCYSPTYVYTEFQSGNKKLYSPYKTKRFITNCTKNDIGGLLTYIPPSHESTLIITKSYKDCRVLRNMGYNSIWLQNEGMIPDLEILLPLVIDFDNVIIFFDNDETGVKASEKLVDILQNYVMGNVYSLHLPFYLYEEKIKDPSDMYKIKGEKELELFLTSNI